MENTEKMGGKVVRDLRDSGVLDSAFPAYQKREMQAMQYTTAYKNTTIQ